MKKEAKNLCILYSGGLDSLIAYKYAKSLDFDKVTCLNVNLNHPYAEKEHVSILNSIESVPELKDDLIIYNLPIVTERQYQFTPPTPDKPVIPGRNMLLASLAVNFGNVVWMNALLGELLPHMPDKNHTFFMMASASLSYTFETNIVVDSPFKTMTKGETVALGLKLGLTSEQLVSTSSCYHQHVKNCGVCLTCVKRAIALRVNGVEEEYASEPFDAPYVERLRWKAKNDMLSQSLYNEYTKAFEMRGRKFV
jgi:7-cyano-7-deazaguanine synthase